MAHYSFHSSLPFNTIKNEHAIINVTLNNAHHASAKILCTLSHNTGISCHALHHQLATLSLHNTHRMLPSLACTVSLRHTSTVIKCSPVYESRGTARKTMNPVSMHTASLHIHKAAFSRSIVFSSTCFSRDHRM